MKTRFAPALLAVSCLATAVTSCRRTSPPVDAARAVATRPPPPSRPADPPIGRVVGAQELLPIDLDPGASLASVHRSEGVMAVAWVQPDRSRAVCRTRDRGASWACRRFAADPERTVVDLVPHGRAEALLFIDSLRGTRRVSSVASLDHPEAALFETRLPVAPSNPVAVVGDVLVAGVAAAGGGRSIERVSRGSTRRSVSPIPFVASAEMAVLPGVDAHEALAIGVEGAPGRRSLVARRVPSSLDAPVGAAEALSPLPTDGALLVQTCVAPRRRWVLAGELLIALPAGDLPAVTRDAAFNRGPQSLRCTDDAVAFWDDSRLVACTARAGCAAPVPSPRGSVAVWLGSEVLQVGVERDGSPGLRWRRAPPGGLATAAWSAITDGSGRPVTARGQWLFELDGRATLFAAGASTTALYTDDGGRRWRWAGEAFVPSTRPTPNPTLR